LQAMALLRLPNEILENIALELALSSPARGAVGPPSPIILLLLTCRSLYARLSWRWTDVLWARIYKAQFDTTAPRRRFGVHVYSSPFLAKQLRDTWTALRSLKATDLSAGPLNGLAAATLLDDLWEAYILLTENDGKNVCQLRWAGAHDVAKRYILERLMDDPSDGWPRDSSLTAMALWVFWVTMDLGKIEKEAVIQQILPFAELSYRYPNFLAPDVSFRLPLPPFWGPEHIVSQVNAHGEYPGFRRPTQSVYARLRYGARLKLVPPPLASAAKLIFTGFRQGPVAIPPDIPLTREEALHLRRRQIRSDLEEINAHKSATPPVHGDWEWFARLSDAERDEETSGTRRAGLAAPSAAFDCEWERLKCYDPWAKPSNKGTPYTLGSLIGLFQGRLFVRLRTDGYLGLLNHAQRPEIFNEFSPYMQSWPMYMRFNEHHCISPASPLGTYVNPVDPVDQGIWQAYMPSRWHCVYDSESITIFDANGKRSKYVTHVPGQPSSHNPETCKMCLSRATAAEDTAQTDVDISALGTDDASIVDAAASDVDMVMSDVGESDEAEEDEEGGDFEVSDWIDNCSGIQDIIFTGETDHEHGLAWGQYKVFGRLRAWDGLIALVRIPSNPNFATWVFRGYLHYESVFVGSWRGMTNMHNATTDVPWEGPFVMARRRDA
ncbi:hypothetical protein K488DRAFT_43975, partial [Vararia minispora EC-137]